MSTVVKKIQCPQCKSTKCTPFGNDKYRCDYCGTEFILDNDDVNIFINHNQAPAATTAPTPPPAISEEARRRNKKLWKVAGCLWGVLIAVFIFAAIIGKCSEKSDKPKSAVAPQTENRTIVRGTELLWSVADTKEPLFIAFEQETKKSTGEVVAYSFVVKEAFTQKELKRIPFEGKDIPKLAVKVISDTSIYVVSDMRTLYKFDTKTLQLTDATNHLKSPYDNLKPLYKEFASGISSIDFSPHKGGLVVITNDGKTYTVFLDTQKIYTSKELSKLKSSQNNFENLPQKKQEHFSVLYQDKNVILIQYKKQKEASFAIEHLDAKTHQSKGIISSASQITQACLYKKGFVLLSENGDISIIDNKDLEK